MIRNWYNQITYPALKTKRELTKCINRQQFTKGTRGKPNEQLFPRQVVLKLNILVSIKLNLFNVHKDKWNIFQNNCVSLC